MRRALPTRRLPVLLGGLLLLGGPAGSRARAETAPDFEKDIRPIFEEKCIRCHGGKRKGGKLDMRTVEAMSSGGVTGPAFKPGNAGKSLLIELIHYREMPPKKEGPVVTAAELELLKRWIEAMPAGAANPTGTGQPEG